ncbi:hypothetical protein KPTA8711_17010 [Klebsiella pneumoniae]|nr:hypothetical protein KPTA8711_17010 [Klebsiella pneumoniae]
MIPHKLIKITLSIILKINTQKAFFERYEYPEYFAINLEAIVPREEKSVATHNITNGVYAKT